MKPIKPLKIKSLRTTRRSVEKELEGFDEWLQERFGKKSKPEVEKCVCGEKKGRQLSIEYDWARLATTNPSLKIKKIILSCLKCGRHVKVFKAKKDQSIKHLLESQASAVDIKEMLFILLDVETNRALYEWRHER